MGNVRLLLHPNIPKPLHGIAPRVIAGKVWWDVEREKACLSAGFRCEACDVSKREALYHQWLEAHEVYDYDYKRGRLTFVRLSALCHACHNFIHDGRMRVLVDKGLMPESKCQEIMDRGLALLNEAGLRKAWEHRHDSTSRVRWEDWRMVFRGKEYGPSSGSMEEWMKGEWKMWKPPVCPKVSSTGKELKRERSCTRRSA